MRGLPFPSDAPYFREESHEFGSPAPILNPNINNIAAPHIHHGALAGPGFDPAYLQDQFLEQSASELQLIGDEANNLHLHHSPDALQRYAQGPQGDPFAQPLPPPFFPPPTEEQTTKPPPPKPQKRKRRPRREEECGFCGGNDSKNRKGEPEQMVSCADCSRSGHPTCMEHPESIGDVLRSYAWKCIECKICEICEEKGDDERILMCDSCDRGWHMDCLNPPLEQAPEGKWFCPPCLTNMPFPLLDAEQDGEENEHEVDGQMDVEIDPALRSEMEIDPALRASSVASSSRSQLNSRSATAGTRRKGKGKASAKGKGKARAPTPSSSSSSSEEDDSDEDDEEEEEDVELDLVDIGRRRPRTTYKGKGKAPQRVKVKVRHRARSRSPSYDVPPPSPPPRPQKRSRPSGVAHSPVRGRHGHGQQPRMVVKLRLPGKGRGRGRDDEDEDERKGLFDDVLSVEERDTSRTGVLSSDKERFERARGSAEEKLIPKPRLPDTTDLSAIFATPGPSSRPLRSTIHQLQLQQSVIGTPRTTSPAPSTPGGPSSTTNSYFRGHTTPNTTNPNPKGKGKDKAPAPLRIRTVRFGAFDIQTWYDAPFPEEFSNIPEGRLWMCEFCLKYMKSGFGAQRHRMKCKARHPPGDEIYRDGSVSIFEVDGRKNKIYCQNLCLLSKMFLDHKSLFYDVEPFLFYVMTEVDDIGARFIGYFSKEKRSPKDFNVSCIMTLPVRQRKGWGNLLIDFSYLLSKKEGRTGTPERPLSGLGAMGYKTYWTLAIMRYLQTAPPLPRLEDIRAATSMTLEDIYVTLSQLDMIRLKATPPPPPIRPSPGQSIKITRSRRNGIARRHLQRTQTGDSDAGPGGGSTSNGGGGGGGGGGGVGGGGNGESGGAGGAQTPVRIPEEYEVRWEVERVERYLCEWEQKGHVKLKPEKLKWTPFLNARIPGGGEVTAPPPPQPLPPAPALPEPQTPLPQSRQQSPPPPATATESNLSSGEQVEAETSAMLVDGSETTGDVDALGSVSDEVQITVVEDEPREEEARVAAVVVTPPPPPLRLEQFADLALAYASPIVRENADEQLSLDTSDATLRSLDHQAHGGHGLTTSPLTSAPITSARSLRSTSRALSSPSRATSNELPSAERPSRLRSHSSSQPPLSSTPDSDVTPTVPVALQPKVVPPPRKRRRVDSAEVEPPCPSPAPATPTLTRSMRNAMMMREEAEKPVGRVLRRQSARLANGDSCDVPMPMPLVSGHRTSSRLNGVAPPDSPSPVKTLSTTGGRGRGNGNGQEHAGTSVERDMDAADELDVKSEAHIVTADVFPNINRHSAPSDDTVCPTPDSLVPHQNGHLPSKTGSPQILDDKVHDVKNLDVNNLGAILGDEDLDADAEGEDDLDAEGEPDVEYEGL